MGSSLFWRASSVFYIESCGQENADLYKSSIENRKIKSKASFEAERLCQFRRLTNYSSSNELGNSQPFYSLTLSYTHSHQNPCGTSFQTSRTCKGKCSVLFPNHFYQYSYVTKVFLYCNYFANNNNSRNKIFITVVNQLSILSGEFAH